MKYLKSKPSVTEEISVFLLCDCFNLLFQRSLFENASPGHAIKENRGERIQRCVFCCLSYIQPLHYLCIIMKQFFMFLGTEFVYGLLAHGKGVAFLVEPEKGTLGPFETVAINITAHSNMWGDYEDHLICKVHAKIFYIYYTIYLDYFCSVNSP